MSSPLHDASSSFLNDTIPPGEEERNPELEDNNISSQDLSCFQADSDEENDIFEVTGSASSSALLDTTMSPGKNSCTSPQKRIVAAQAKLPSGKSPCRDSREKAKRFRKSSSISPRKAVSSRSQVLFWSPEKQPTTTSPCSTKSDLNQTKDLFSSSQGSSDGSVVYLSSPEKSCSPKKQTKKSPTTKSKSSPPANKQCTIDRFLLQKSSANTSNRKRIQQSKMDLYVKWKDPARLEMADKARREFFTKPSKRKESGMPINVTIHSSSAHKTSNSQESVDEDCEAPSTSTTVNTSEETFDSEKSSRDALEIMCKKDKELKQRQKLMKNMFDDQFAKHLHNPNLENVKEEQRKNLKDGQIVRQKADRERMHAADCPCCKKYYDALDLSPGSKQKRIQQVGRHRYVELPKPKTPEHYWELGFPTDSEQKRRGYIRVKSPMKKQVAKKLFK